MWALSNRVRRGLLRHGVPLPLLSSLSGSGWQQTSPHTISPLLSISRRCFVGASAAARPPNGFHTSAPLPVRCGSVQGPAQTHRTGSLCVQQEGRRVGEPSNRGSLDVSLAWQPPDYLSSASLLGWLSKSYSEHSKVWRLWSPPPPHCPRQCVVDTPHVNSTFPCCLAVVVETQRCRVPRDDFILSKLVLQFLFYFCHIITYIFLFCLFLFVFCFCFLFLFYFVFCLFCLFVFNFWLLGRSEVTSRSGCQEKSVLWVSGSLHLSTSYTTSSRPHHCLSHLLAKGNVLPHGGPERCVRKGMFWSRSSSMLNPRSCFVFHS